MRNLTKSIMLGLLLIPFAALINYQGASAEETATVIIVSGSQTVGCEVDDMCWDPSMLTVPVGTTVAWINEDSAAHTVVGASDPTDPGTWSDITVGGEVFDSMQSAPPLINPGAEFSFAFTEAGEFPYVCSLHPHMIGSITVTEEMAPPEMPGMMGTNFDLSIDADLPFDRMANEMITLSFTAKATELEGASMTPGEIDHLDYKVMIMRDGMEVWSSNELHDHDGNLELQITPSSGPVMVSGGGDDDSGTGAYMVTGDIFSENGSYTIAAQVVGIEFNPLASPIQEDFTIEVVPEFPITAILPMVLAFGAVVAVMRLRPKQGSII